MNKNNEGTAKAIFDAALKKYQPALLEKLQGLRKKDLVVVHGGMDHIGQVLDAMALPHELVQPDHIQGYAFHPEQTVFIECPGKGIDQRGLKNIETFVHHGGKLITTDWAVKNVLEKAFPDMIAHNSRTTGDNVVKIDLDDAVAKHFVGLQPLNNAEPKWWLEHGSYPVDVKSSDVASLLQSKELAEKYGSPYIAVAFRSGDGMVYHFVSHLYLQRSELRTARDKAPSSTLSTALGLDDVIDWKKMDVKTKLGDVEGRFAAFYSVATVLGTPHENKKNSLLDNVLFFGKKKIILEPHYNTDVLYHQQKCPENLSLEMNGKEVTLGRSSEADIAILDTLVSRRHASLARRGFKVILRDLGSANGTYYNGIRVGAEGLPLLETGKIQLGDGYFIARVE